jgi:sugar phosphate permease
MGKRYPWLVATMGLLVLFLSNGFTATALSVFDESLLNEFGWDRGELKFRDFLNFAIIAVLAPFVGIVIDRVNPKWLLLTGLTLLSASYLTYSQLAEGRIALAGLVLAGIALVGLAVMLVIIWRSGVPPLARAAALAIVLATMLAVVRYAFIAPSALSTVYVIHVVFALALSTAGTMVVIVLVSSWFLKHRGLAIGIALLGTSVGGIVLSPINAWLIGTAGWRQAFAWLAWLPVALAVLVLLLVRGTPKDAGAVAVGQDSGATDLKQFGYTFAEAIRTPVFWAIGVSGFLTYYSILAIFNHLFLHMRALGFEPQIAARSLALLGATAAVAKLAIGWLSDFIDRKLVFLACLAVMLGGVALLAAQAVAWVWWAIFIIGLGWGGLFTLYNMLTVNNFGLKEIGRINGSVSFLESLGGGLGIWLTGVLYDRYGNYEVPFLVIAACVFLGLLAGTRIRSGSAEAMGARA